MKHRLSTLPNAIRLSVVIVVVAGAVLTLAGCGGTSGGGDASSPSAVKVGGTFNVGTGVPSSLDPATVASLADWTVAHQLYRWLVWVDPKGRLQPELATSWSSDAAGKTWTIKLRPTAKFSDGQPLTAEDVVYTFKRLQDPKIGSPGLEVFKNVKSIQAVDAQTVEFRLAAPNPAFPIDLSEPHAGIIAAGTRDPLKTKAYSGPFVLQSLSGESEATLSKNKYWDKKDAQGRALPYLDTVRIVFSPDAAGQAEALRSGELNFVALPPELAATVKDDPAVSLIRTPVPQFYAIHMRSDEGHIASNPDFRRALMLGTDYQALLTAAYMDLGTLSNGTPIGPSFADYYLDQPHAPDVEKAKQLMAQAGYPDGAKIKLVTQPVSTSVAIATVWKEQMAKIGVTVDIQQVPTDVYYGGSGENNWLECDFGVTDWGARPNPVNYFQLALVTDAPYNESHWSDAEFDALTVKIATEMDAATRAGLYKQAQQILIDRGPYIIPFFLDATLGVSSNIAGVVVHQDVYNIVFDTVHYTD